MQRTFRTLVRRNFTVGAFFFRALATAGMIACSGVVSLAADPDPVVAIIGSRKITEKELDAKIKPQLAAVQSQIYEIKVSAIQNIADEYALQQAAKKESVSVDDYLKKHLGDKKVTNTDAKMYYDQHKELQSRYPKYDQIKGKLVEALQSQQDQQQRAILVDKLRKEQPVTVMLTAPRIEVKNAPGHPELGSAAAPVTIVEFSDFQCPYCSRAEPALKQVRDKYGDKVRLVYEDFPLGIHDHAIDAASAGRCAGEQGKFWQFHDQMFANQGKLAPADLKDYAKKLSLDTARFDDCFDQGKYKKTIESDMAQGRDLGVEGTPAFFVNGRPLTGAQPFEKFQTTIDEELAGSAQKQAQK